MHWGVSRMAAEKCQAKSPKSSGLWAQLELGDDTSPEARACKAEPKRTDEFHFGSSWPEIHYNRLESSFPETDRLDMISTSDLDNRWSLGLCPGSKKGWPAHMSTPPGLCSRHRAFGRPTDPSYGMGRLWSPSAGPPQKGWDSLWQLNWPWAFRPWYRRDELEALIW